MTATYADSPDLHDFLVRHTKHQVAVLRHRSQAWNRAEVHHFEATVLMCRAVFDIGGAAAKKAVEVTPQDFQVDGFPLVDHLFKRCQGTDSTLAGPARLAKVSYLHRNVEDSAGRSGGILPEEMS